MALENDKDSTAAAAAAAVAAHTTAPQGLCKVLIKRVVLKTQALVPVSPYELKVGSVAGCTGMYLGSCLLMHVDAMW
jgi:hypothetical protein